jgi:hypothetical protein
MAEPLKADVTAADRLLKAAVRRAVEMLRAPGRMREVSLNRRTWAANPTLTNATHLSYEWVKPDPAEIVAMLATATHAADILLADDKRPAKKAAARKGAS